MLFIYVRPVLEAYLEQLKPFSLWLLSQLIPILLFFWHLFPSVIHICACAMGMGIGVFVNHSLGWSLAPSKTIHESMVRGSIGVAGTFLCYFLVSVLPLPKSLTTTFCIFLFLSLWITTGSLLVCRQLFSSAALLSKPKSHA